MRAPPALPLYSPSRYYRTAMDPTTLLSSFALLFLAEMGDKTQLMVMTLAHRHRATPVILGGFAAFAVLNLLAVFVGQGVARLIPREAVLLAAGSLFLLFAGRSLSDSQEEGATTSDAGQGAVWLASFALIFVAELGDKTQLAMIALAAQTSAPWSVFLGGTLALWGVTVIGAVLGVTLLRRIPHRWVHRGAALLFLAFGLLAMAEAVRLLLQR